MSDYGVTDAGFVRKPKTVTITELENLLKAQFGQDLDVDAESPEGQIISVIADAADPLWEVAEYAYNAFNPNAATGTTLENLVQINNLTKQLATESTVTVTFYGDNGTSIPKGTIISSNSSLTGGTTYKFETETAGVIASGSYSVLAIAQESGAVQIPIGSMTLLDSPIVGLDSLTNILAGNVGTDDESDVELRSRRTSQVALASVSTVDAIYAGLLNIDTVLSVSVYENDTVLDITADGITIEPHSIMAVVQGAATEVEAEEIAQVMFIRKSPGVRTLGDQSHTIQDSQGFDKTFNWNVPTLVPIVINITTKADSATALATSGSEIKDAIIAYIEDPVTGYAIGDEVSYGRLYTPINSIAGHNVQSLEVGYKSDGVMIKGDLNINGASLATITDPDTDINIEITY